MPEKKFVNKVKKNEEEYDIQDARIPEVETTDADKVIKVNAEGQFELGEVEGGVTEERVQQMIDASIGDALTARY